jgi:hypothetical protein
VGSSSTNRLATGDEAWSQLTDAVRGFAGGSGWTLVIFVVLALTGAALLLRRQPAFVGWGAAALVLPPLLSTLVHTGRAPDLSPRHLIFALPFWAAFVGAAVARAPARPLAVVAAAILIAVSPQGIYDPRSITYTARLGSEESLAAPAAWLRERIEPGDVLFPYSSIFLAALPEAGQATALARAQAGPVLEALDTVDYPIGRVFAAVPIGIASVRLSVLRGHEFARFPSWITIELRGPFPDRVAVLAALEDVLAAVRQGLGPPLPAPLVGWFALNLDVLCQSLRSLNAGCVSE